MGRGAKIYLLSALSAAIIFGLIAFVIISAILDKKAQSEKPEPRESDTEAAYHEIYYDNILEER